MLKFIKKNLFYKSKNDAVNNLKILIFGTIFFYFVCWRLSDLEFGINNLDQLVLVRNLYSPLFDNSYFEFFQYTLLLWCSIISLKITLKGKFKFARPIPFIYLFLFLNDFFRIHDRVITLFSKYLSNRYILMKKLFIIQGLDEVLYWLFVLLLIILVSYLFLKNSNQESQEFFKFNLYFFIVLGFFGLIIDEFNNILYFLGDNVLLKIIRFSLFTLEEFGEISTISFAFIWLMNIASNKKIIKKRNI